MGYLCIFGLRRTWFSYSNASCSNLVFIPTQNAETNYECNININYIYTLSSRSICEHLNMLLWNEHVEDTKSVRWPQGHLGKSTTWILCEWWIVLCCSAIILYLLYLTISGMMEQTKPPFYMAINFCFGAKAPSDIVKLSHFEIHDQEYTWQCRKTEIDWLLIGQSKATTHVLVHYSALLSLLNWQFVLWKKRHVTRWRWVNASMANFVQYWWASFHSIFKCDAIRVAF